MPVQDPEPPGQRPWHDDDLVMISAIEHWSYCPRQCALIHLEQTYDENIYTMRGTRSHERVHQDDQSSEHGLRVSRGLSLWSNALGLVGKADLVEWHGPIPYPVEFKVGRKRQWAHETLQLCAQAICLEEMLDVEVPCGAISYISSNRRREVTFTPALRQDVAATVGAIRAMLAEQRLPLAINDARCPNCSLIDACTPALAAHPASIRGHCAELFRPADLMTGGGRCAN